MLNRDEKEPNKLFSVIIPTYNRGFVLKDALESILGQGVDTQIIVIDDGSTDNTIEVLAPFKDRITYHYQTNQGQSVARNVGIGLSRGLFISFLDSDDVFLPGKLKRECELFQEIPDAEVIISKSELWLFDELLPDKRMPSEIGNISNIQPLKTLKPLWLKSNIASTCCHAFRKSCLLKLNQRFFDSDLPHFEDWDFFSRLYHHCNAYVLPEVTARVRRYDDGTRKKRHIPGQALTPEQLEYSKKYQRIVANRIQRMITSNKPKSTT